MPTAKRTFGMVETVYRLSGREDVVESPTAWRPGVTRKVEECGSRTMLLLLFGVLLDWNAETRVYKIRGSSSCLERGSSSFWVVVEIKVQTAYLGVKSGCGGG